VKATPKRNATKTGRFLLRIPAALHQGLREAARHEGISLNEYCTRLLGCPPGSRTANRDATAAVSRAVVLFGRDLVAVAAFGSWARGELATGSDVDVLIVLERRIELTRDLYRRWDAEMPLRWSGKPVDAHFVHLPDPGRPVIGVWAEVAVDGVVLFERDFRFSGVLVGIRQDIAAGRIVRRAAHGQPYWTVA
jgi:predicted nucleotidyltransferase